MKRLTQLQNDFQSYILAPDPAPPRAWVSDKGRSSADIRLNVYAHAYRARLQEVMEIDYPAVSAALDTDRFDQLVEAYIQQYPSTYFSLRDFGKRFHNHLKGSLQGSIGEQSEGWLHELALFELRLAQAFDAADRTPVNEQDLTQFSADLWPSLRFEFVPSLSLLDLEWNTPSLWKALTSGQPSKIEAVRGEPTRWLIWRQDLVTRFRSLEQDEQVMMDGLIQGGTFNEACLLLSALLHEETVPMRAAGLLKGWVNQGLIASVY